MVEVRPIEACVCALPIYIVDLDSVVVGDWPGGGVELAREEVYARACTCAWREVKAPERRLSAK